MTHDLEGLTSARAVWDFTTGDARRFFDRVSLMKQTAESFLAGSAAGIREANPSSGPSLKDRLPCCRSGGANRYDRH